MLCGSTQLWPQPTGPVTLSTSVVKLHPRKIELDTNNEEPIESLVRHAFTIFQTNIENLVLPGAVYEEAKDERRLIVRVNLTDAKNAEVRLRMKTDEGYNLTLNMMDEDMVANIQAATFFGARHGLETLSQLIWFDFDKTDGCLKILKAASVIDKPVFAYRGLLVDTSRNFMPVEHIKRVLVGMAANKLNVFHWHVSDSQSFPLEIPSVPLLAKYGAYSPDMLYTRLQVIDIVEYARVRGIRVVIEIDTPAHAGNGWTWGPQEGLGQLAVCVNARPWSLYCGEPPCGQLNPENPNVYNLLENLYRDVMEMSDENEIFHIGGDEVNLECWEQYLPKTSASYNYTDLHDLWGEFTLKALKRVEKANGGVLPEYVIVWSSNLSKRPYASKYIDKERFVVQSWGSSQWPQTTELLEDGYKILVSHVDAWYLDCGFGKWRETGEAACDPYRPWQTVYTHRPWNPITKKQMIGGEVCLWSEQLDAASLDTRLWPRAAAFAERVWSDPLLNDDPLVIQEDVYTRLVTQRERLLSRGLSAEAMWPLWCSQNPGMCL